MRVPAQALRRILVPLVTASLAFALGSCGDDGSSGARQATAPEQADGGKPRSSAQPGPDSAPTGRRDAPAVERPGGGPGAARSENGPGDSDEPAGEEERRAAGIVSGMYQDLVTGDAASVCAAMSTQVREQIAQNVPGGSTEAPEDRTCEESLAKFLDAAGRSGLLERTVNAEVVGVRVDGRRAVATVSLSGRTGEVQLFKEDGEWRFGASPLGGSR